MNVDNFTANLFVVVNDGSANRLLYQQLSGLGFNTHLLPASADLSSLHTLIQQQSPSGGLASVHLYCHGEPGKLALARPTVAPHPLDRAVERWQSIGEQLKPGGDLLLYGCELAKGSSGRTFVDRLARLTQRDVAASTDITGLGGDWDLEYRRGTIESTHTDVLTGMNWEGSLATRLNEPVKVPLHWVELSKGKDPDRKLGIYATIGAGRSPQLFELDTGGEGFYAAYGDTSIAPWWGSRWSSSGKPFEMVYDSGLTYTGNVVKADIELFAGPNPAKARLKAEGVTLGQTNSITNNKQGEGTLWPLPESESPPPVNGVFYGDFGLAPRIGESNINSLTHQMRYGKGLVAGFRVHASERKPWVQFGLTPRDLKPTKNKFRLETSDPGSISPTGVPFYNFNVTSGVLDIRVGRGSDQRGFTRERTGIILDTGAQTTIHQKYEDLIPSDLTIGATDKQIIPGALVAARGKSVSSSHWGEMATILSTRAGSETSEKIMIQDTGKTYLNTGIRPFLTHDVIYNLKDSKLILIPRSRRE